MRIIHIADLHLNASRKAEYLAVLNNLIDNIEHYTPHYVVIAGDTFDNKLSLKPDEYAIFCWFIKSIVDLNQNIHVILILGNHDVNSTNPNARDIITPLIQETIVDNEKYMEYVHFYPDNGVYNITPEVEIYVFGPKHHQPLPVVTATTRVYKIAIVHETIKGTYYPNGQIADEAERITLNELEGFHAVMAGDVHKMQFLKPHIAYPGSLIQQNFGEDPLDHGFILWEFKDYALKSARFHRVENPYGAKVAIVCQNNETKFDFPDIKIAECVIKGSRCSSVWFEELRAKVCAKYGIQPSKIQLVPMNNYTSMPDEPNNNNIGAAKLFDYPSWVADHPGFSPEQKETLRNHWRQYAVGEYLPTVGLPYDILYVEWQNMFSYTADQKNWINFTQIPGGSGIIGILGQNATGKSSIIEIISFLLFSDNSKDTNIETICNLKSKTYYGFVVFKHSGNTYKVLRSGTAGSKKATMKIYRNGEQICSGIKESKDILKGIVGTHDNFVLINCQYQNQDLLTDKTERAQQSCVDILLGNKNVEFIKMLSNEILIIDTQIKAQQRPSLARMQPVPQPPEHDEQIDITIANLNRQIGSSIYQEPKLSFTPTVAKLKDLDHEHLAKIENEIRLNMISIKQACPHVQKIKLENLEIPKITTRTLREKITSLKDAIAQARAIMTTIDTKQFPTGWETIPDSVIAAAKPTDCTYTPEMLDGMIQDFNTWVKTVLDDDLDWSPPEDLPSLDTLESMETQPVPSQPAKPPPEAMKFLLCLATPDSREAELVKLGREKLTEMHQSYYTELATYKSTQTECTARIKEIQNKLSKTAVELVKAQKNLEFVNRMTWNRDCAHCRGNAQLAEPAKVYELLQRELQEELKTTNDRLQSLRQPIVDPRIETVLRWYDWIDYPQQFEAWQTAYQQHQKIGAWRKYYTRLGYREVYEHKLKTLRDIKSRLRPQKLEFATPVALFNLQTYRRAAAHVEQLTAELFPLERDWDLIHASQYTQLEKQLTECEYWKNYKLWNHQQGKIRELQELEDLKKKNALYKRFLAVEALWVAYEEKVAELTTKKMDLTFFKQSFISGGYYEYLRSAAIDHIYNTVQSHLVNIDPGLEFSINTSFQIYLNKIPLNCTSGFQKAIINILLRAAILQIVQIPHLENTIIIDESILNTCDETNATKVKQIFLSLGLRLIIITHNPDFKSLARYIISTDVKPVVVGTEYGVQPVVAPIEDPTKQYMRRARRAIKQLN